jgi:chromosome segregation ATPase
MNNLTKYLPMLLLLGILICVVLLVKLNSNLDRAVERIEQAEHKIDSSFISLRSARLEIDSARSGIATFSAYVRDIQGRVEILDLNERMLSDRFKGQGDKLKSRLRELYKEVEQTGKELPDVPLVRKNN